MKSESWKATEEEERRILEHRAQRKVRWEEWFAEIPMKWSIERESRFATHSTIREKLQKRYSSASAGD